MGQDLETNQFRRESAYSVRGMAPEPRLYMIGLVSQLLERSDDFYRRLGLDFQDTVGTHREVHVPDLTFFIDGRPSNWHPGFEERPYPWLLEFYFESLADLRSKIDELTGAGYDLIDEPYDNGFGMWFAFIADPDGNTVLLSSQQSPDDD
jgi:catechol 2,3-dioxygenase-like lactoylglutathione lyase family enzyme